MVTKKDFERIMNKQTEIALATSINNQPNVRIVNFYFEIATNTLFFTSFRDNHKVKEFEANPNVAFSTIPHQGNEHVRAKGIVKKSEKTIYDVAEEFISKISDYKEIIEKGGQSLVLFEIKFDLAIVILDIQNIGKIKLNEK